MAKTRQYLYDHFRPTSVSLTDYNGATTDKFRQP